MKKTCPIFVGADECVRIFDRLVSLFGLGSFKIVESDATTFVLHPLETKMVRAKSFNALWERNDMENVLVVLSHEPSAGRMPQGYYYPHVNRNKKLRNAIEAFENMVCRGGYWLTPDHPNHDESQFSSITFVGYDVVEKWRAGVIVLGNERQRYFEPRC